MLINQVAKVIQTCLKTLQLLVLNSEHMTIMRKSMETILKMNL